MWRFFFLSSTNESICAFQDLVGMSNAQKRNWRGILIALMVIVAVLAMIIMSVVLLTPEEDFGLGGRWRRMRGRRIRLTDVLEDEQSHSVQLFNGTWISGETNFD